MLGSNQRPLPCESPQACSTFHHEHDAIPRRVRRIDRRLIHEVPRTRRVLRSSKPSRRSLSRSTLLPIRVRGNSDTLPRRCKASRAEIPRIADPNSVRSGGGACLVVERSPAGHSTSSASSSSLTVCCFQPAFVSAYSTSPCSTESVSRRFATIC
jgi:hypothetical protein